MYQFKDRFKYLKAKHNMTYKQLSELLNLQERTIKCYASGTIDPPISKLIILADYFNVSLDYIVGRSDNPEINK